MKVSKKILPVLALLALLTPALLTAGVKKKSLAGVININTASVEQIAMLPGVGPKKAERIADYRDVNAFHNLEDLTQVKGIGEKQLAKMKPFLVLKGDTTAYWVTQEEAKD
jgi:competence protein ComEA